MSAEPNESFLSPTQRRVVAGSLVVLAVGVTLSAIIVGFVILGELTSYFSGVLWPLAVAGVVALILRPVVTLIEKRLRLQRSAAVVLLYGGFVLVCGLVLVLAVPPLIDQCLNFIAYAPTLWANGSAYFDQRYPEWVALIQRQLAHPAVKQAADSLVAEFNTLLSHALPTLRTAGGGVVDLVGFVTHIAIIPVYVFFFLLARGQVVETLSPQLPFLKKSLRDDVLFLVGEFIEIVESFFRGQLVIGLIMGILLAFGFTVVGLKFGLIIGLVVGVLNIIPYLGTIVGLCVALPLAFLQPDGGWKLVGLVLAVKLIVQLIEGWVLTPKIMGERTGLHPVAIIVAIFFWGTVFHGVLGMVLAIPLTAFFVTAWRLAKRKYFVRGA